MTHISPSNKNNEEPERPLLTLPEVAKKLRISRWMVYELINRRQLTSITIGSRRFVTAVDLDAYINSRRHVGAA
jgi:excisionase family DNA binding protein